MNSTTQIQPVNSLTYVDMAALNLGISRMQGESSVAFLQRCYLATTRLRNHTYEGTQDEIGLQLGLKQWAGISISSTDAGLVVLGRIGLVTVTTGGVAHDIPTVLMAADNYWTWRSISDVVQDLNGIAGVTAVLTGPDGPALQIASQSNILTVVREPVLAVTQMLAHANVITSSLLLSNSAASYMLEPTTGKLTFPAVPSAGLLASYQYIALPYNMVLSEICLFGLAETSLASVGVSADNTLAYQLREAVQAVMTADPSYWTE